LLAKEFEIESVIPKGMERFPWRGHLGLQLLDQVIEVVEQAGSTLLFTNTRAQTEIWYREMLAARTAAGAGSIEERKPLEKPLDVLAQHIVTVAAGGGFEPTELYQEVRTTYAYKDLSVEEWDWIVDFASRGGQSLRAYSEFHRVSQLSSVCRVADERVAKRHRISIGTITGDETMRPFRFAIGVVGCLYPPNWPSRSEASWKRRGRGSISLRK
jgi:Lhr-like helicase